MTSSRPEGGHVTQDMSFVLPGQLATLLPALHLSSRLFAGGSKGSLWGLEAGVPGTGAPHPPAPNRRAPRPIPPPAPSPASCDQPPPRLCGPPRAHVTPPLPAPPSRPSAGSHWLLREDPAPPFGGGAGDAPPAAERGSCVRTVRGGRTGLAGGRSRAPGAAAGRSGRAADGAMVSGARKGRGGGGCRVLGPGGALQKGKGRPRLGLGRALGGSVAGWGVAAAGEGQPGLGARLRGEGLFRGAAPAGGGSLSAALRRDRDKGGGGGRRRRLCRERVYPPTQCVPLTAARSWAPQAGRGAPRDT